MHNVYLALVFVVIFFPSLVFAYGEGEGTFPSLKERQLLLLTNEARADIKSALKDCKRCGEASCYPKSLAPMYYDAALSKAARFHSEIMQESACFEHHSPCKLKDSIADSYPETCRSMGCACVGEVSCAQGESAGKRISRFYRDSSYVGENILMSTLEDVEHLFRIWILEPSDTSACEATSANGHRWSLLHKDFNRSGIGVWGHYATQDFASHPGEVHEISAATHFQHAEGQLFKAHWYSGAKLCDMRVNVEGTCYGMDLSVGNDNNGVFSYETDALGSKFSYRFEAQTCAGVIIRYPTKGTLMVGSQETWSEGKLNPCDFERIRGKNLKKKFKKFKPKLNRESKSDSDLCRKCVECGACRLSERCVIRSDETKSCETIVSCEDCP